MTQSVTSPGILETYFCCYSKEVPLNSPKQNCIEYWGSLFFAPVYAQLGLCHNAVIKMAMFVNSFCDLLWQHL